MGEILLQGQMATMNGDAVKLYYRLRSTKSFFIWMLTL
jgi:hypothetical protein